MQVKWKCCNGLSRYLVGITSSIGFTRLTTFGRKHHSPPYNILYASPWGLHPNVTFPQNSQVGVPKLGLLLSQNFGHSNLSQIKYILKVQGQYFKTFENIFLTVYNIFNWTSFDPCFQGNCGWESNFQFDSYPFFCS